MNSVLIAPAIMMGLGLFFGVIIAFSYRYLKVDEDPRIDGTNNLLPGTNCGACGTPGCRAFAIALIDGDKVPTACTVMGPEEVDDVASFLGVDAGETAKVVARLLCAGGTDCPCASPLMAATPLCGRCGTTPWVLEPLYTTVRLVVVVCVPLPLVPDVTLFWRYPPPARVDPAGAILPAVARL